MSRIALPPPELWTLDAGLEVVGDMGIRLIGSIGGQDAIPALTSATTPSPYVVTTSSEYGGGYEAWKIFDNSSPGAPFWQTATGVTAAWMKLFVGVLGIIPIKIRILPYSIPSYSPKDFFFKGSNTDENWATLLTQTNITDWVGNQWKEFEFANTTSFKNLMLDVTANNGGANYLIVEQMEIWGAAYYSTGPVAESPWFGIDKNVLDATLPIVLLENKIAALFSLLSFGNLKYQVAFNYGSYNGSWLTQAQLVTAIISQAISNHTNSMRLKAQFNSDSSQPVDMSGFGSSISASGVSGGGGGGGLQIINGGLIHV